jgi:hypothetical protein
VNRIGGLWIMSSQNGDQFHVYQGGPVSEGDVIDQIALCYRVDGGASIASLGLVEILLPGATTGSKSGHVDTTELASLTDTCYVSRWTTTRRPAP